jgi:glucose-6-phosphate isomerase
LVSVISKSGGTTETVANFEMLMQALRQKCGDVTNRVVAITDEGSKLWEAAGAKNMARLAIPKPAGGRYSVLSPVGLLPLLSVGIDVEAVRRGASDILEQCFHGENSAAESAAILAAQLVNGYHINDNFFFHPELESVGKWYRQLLGESVGKETSLSGETVHTGITPTVSLGSTDLHSVGQLYLGGPKDKLTTFVSTQKSAEISVPAERVLPELIPMINGKTATDIMRAILEGVKVAYQKADLPFMEIVLEDTAEHSLGAYLQFKMLEMMYLGQLLNVNSFDQPNVEMYKIETKKILEG